MGRTVRNTTVQRVSDIGVRNFRSGPVLMGTLDTLAPLLLSSPLDMKEPEEKSCSGGGNCCVAALLGLISSRSR